MSADLLDDVAPQLQGGLARWGFVSARLRVSAQARAFFGIKREGVAHVRTTERADCEFLFFQRGPDRYSLSAFAGWAPKPGMPPPHHAADFPTEDASELARASFVFPVFTLFSEGGIRWNARRLEGDGWLLLPVGQTPTGLSDDALAAGIKAQLEARAGCERLWGTDAWPGAVQQLAGRILQDLQDVVLPYLARR